MEQCLRTSTLKRLRLLSRFLDAFTIVLSIADVVTDWLALFEMKKFEYVGFFWMSLTTFAMAHLSYVWAFDARFISSKRILHRAIIWLVILPIAQLIPLFLWLEEQRFGIVDRALVKMKLKACYERPADTDTDSLHGVVTAKVRSHTGFIIESFVEAIPQAALTTAFIVVSGDSSLVIIMSVVLSITTIASKTYILSFPIDSLAFSYNILLGVADCIGLFASVTVLAQHGINSAVAKMVVVVFVCVLASAALGGVCCTISDLASFVLGCRRCEPHTTRRSDLIKRIKETLVRFTQFCFLGSIPAVAMLAYIRLSFIHLLMRFVFAMRVESRDDHIWFFSELLAFLRSRRDALDGELRLRTINAFIVHQPKLKTKARSDIDIREWTDIVTANIREWSASVRIPSSLPSRSERGVLQTIACSLRDFGIKDFYLPPIELKEFEDAQLWQFKQQPLNVILWAARLFFSVISSVSIFCLILSLLVLFPVAVLLPTLHLASEYRAFSAGSSAALLPCILYFSYAVSLVIILLISPAVLCKQVLWLHLESTGNLRDEFFDKRVLAEIQKRYLRERCLQALASKLEERLGQDLPQHIYDFVDLNFSMAKQRKRENPPAVVGSSSPVVPVAPTITAVAPAPPAQPWDSSSSCPLPPAVAPPPVAHATTAVAPAPPAQPSASSSSYRLPPAVAPPSPVAPATTAVASAPPAQPSASSAHRLHHRPNHPAPPVAPVPPAHQPNHHPAPPVAPAHQWLPKQWLLEPVVEPSATSSCPIPSAFGATSSTSAPPPAYPPPGKSPLAMKLESLPSSVASDELVLPKKRHKKQPTNVQKEKALRSALAVDKQINQEVDKLSQQALPSAKKRPTKKG